MKYVNSNYVAIILIRAGYTVSSAKRAAVKAENVHLYGSAETGITGIDFTIVNHAGEGANYSFEIDPVSTLITERWQHVEPSTECLWTSFYPTVRGPVGHSGNFNAVNKFGGYSTDELVDFYCDWGAMGVNMDCDEEEWDELCEELERRGEIC